jgi:hypothetical protein
MSTESNMEQAVKDAGFEIMSGPPSSVEQAQTTETPAPQTEGVPENNTPTEPAVQQTAEPVEQAQQEPAPVQEQVAQESQPQVESGSSMTTEQSATKLDFLDSLETSEMETPAVEESDEVAEVASTLDPRIQVIADFVEKTGRNPEDWFRYQSLEPSEMDDSTVMRVHLASEYPSLGNDEIDTLINSKYKTDESLHSDEEVKIAKLQLKIDAQKARQAIDTLRSEYVAPAVEPNNDVSEDGSNPFDTSWLQESGRSLAGLDKISFDLPGGKEFHFGVAETYRNELNKSNTNMNEYFDKYVGDDGSWDHDLWNMHRTVTDNLPSIIENVYRQGMSDGQRGIVEKAANIDPNAPAAPVQRQDNSVANQVLDALGRRQPFLKNM